MFYHCESSFQTSSRALGSSRMCFGALSPGNLLLLPLVYGGSSCDGVSKAIVSNSRMRHYTAWSSASVEPILALPKGVSFRSLAILAVR